MSLNFYLLPIMLLIKFQVKDSLSLMLLFSADPDTLACFIKNCLNPIAAHQVMPHQHHQPLRGELPEDGAEVARVDRPGAPDRRVFVVHGVLAGMVARWL